jgi:hypothetical protein
MHEGSAARAASRTEASKFMGVTHLNVLEGRVDSGPADDRTSLDEEWQSQGLEHRNEEL